MDAGNVLFQKRNSLAKPEKPLPVEPTANRGSMSDEATIGQEGKELTAKSRLTSDGLVAEPGGGKLARGAVLDERAVQVQRAVAVAVHDLKRTKEKSM